LDFIVRLEVAIHVDKAGSVPYSNQTLAADPFGFTVPFRTARLVKMEQAGRVWTAGGDPLLFPDEVALFLPAHDTSEMIPTMLRMTKNKYLPLFGDNPFPLRTGHCSGSEVETSITIVLPALGFGAGQFKQQGGVDRGTYIEKEGKSRNFIFPTTRISSKSSFIIPAEPGSCEELLRDLLYLRKIVSGSLPP